MTGLEKQPIAINIAGGLDTKTDAKNVIPGRLTTLENGVYRKDKRIDKRPGHDQLPNIDLDGNDLGTGQGITNFKDEVLQYNSNKLYSYSPNSNAWCDKGDLVLNQIKTRNINRTSSHNFNPDSATLNGITVFAWEDYPDNFVSAPSLRASVIDNETGTLLIANKIFSLSGRPVNPRCLAFQGHLYIFFYERTVGYRMAKINASNPSDFEPLVTVATVLSAFEYYDVISYNDQRIMFVYNYNDAGTPPTYRIRWLDANGATLTGPLATLTVDCPSDAVESLAIIRGPGQTFYIAFYDGTSVYCTIRSNSGGQIVSAFLVETLADVENITGYATSSGIVLYYSVNPATLRNSAIRKVTISTLGVVGTPSFLAKSVSLYSVPFAYVDVDGNENNYVVANYFESGGLGLQDTYFVLDSNGSVIGKMQYTNAGFPRTHSILSKAHQITSSKFGFAIATKYGFVSQNGSIQSPPQGVSYTTIDFNQTGFFNPKALGNNLLIPGGVLSMYDGQSVVEHGFHLYPSNLSISQAGSAGVGIGSYQYVALYEWTDGFGQRHRSQPSVAASFSVTGSARNVTVAVEALRLTRKVSPFPVVIALFRTLTGPGDIFYRVGSLLSPSYNDSTANTVSIVDTTSDANIVTNEILYTIGGTLPNNPAPACSVIDVFQNRIFLAGLEDPHNVLFSKECKSGEPIEFTDDFNKSVESSGGDETAMGVINDKLLLFKPNTFFYLFGDGPNNTNTLGAFSEFIASNSDAGCDNTSSVVRMQNALIMKSPKGFYVVPDSLVAFYVGADVEDYNDLTVTSGVLIPDLNEIRFMTSDGDMITYNYFFNKWSTATGLKATGATLFQQKHLLLKTNGKVYQASESFKDGNVSYRMKLVTGWISLTGVTSWKRIYQVIILGTYKSKHKLRVSVAYDYSDSWIACGSFDPDTKFPVKLFGQNSPFGTGDKFGGKSIAYCIQVKLKRQKCAALRIMIEELVTTATEGSQESFNISDLGLLMGVKAGNMKLGKSRKLGVK